MPEEKQFIIREGLANALINYLASKPYSEVFQLLGALQQMSQLPKPKQEKEPKPTK